MVTVMRIIAAGIAVLSAAVVLPLPAGVATADPPPQVVRQPAQPTSGPGGSDYPHRGMRVHAGGTGADSWYVFQPVQPKPQKAPLAVVMHGYFEYAGYGSMAALIRHTVRKGTVVIYPRWQTDVAAPCPGPFDVEPCIESAVAGIKGGIRWLRAIPNRVQPQLRKTSYFGFSFGGVVTANMTNRWRALNLPIPRAIFLDDLHDGGLAGPGEPALDDSMTGIPATALVQCHVGAAGVIAKDPGGSCNALVPKLRHIPKRHKDLVLTRTDSHGRPALKSDHGVCAAGTSASGEVFGRPNAYDWNFCWKVWDALRNCALVGEDCRYALGNTRQHRRMGRWSDGKAVKQLRVQNRAPIRP